MSLARASHRTAARLSAATQPLVHSLLEPLEGRRLLSAVSVIGSNGVVIQSSGAPVVLDYDANQHAVLERYAGGTTQVLDPTFGSGGQVATSLNAITDIARGPGDQLVIAGNQTVARFTANGAIDTSFGFGAGSIAAVPSTESISAVGVQGDGKIVVAANDNNADGSVVLRFNADGTPDTSFGNGGSVAIVPTQGPGTHVDLLNDLVVEPNGDIAVVGREVATGASFNSPLIAQVNPNGTIAWQQANSPQVNGGYGAVAVAPDGSLVAAGSAYNVSLFENQSLVARYSAAGQTIFANQAGDQFALPESRSLLGVGVTTDGKVVVAGDYGTGGTLDASNFYAERYDLNSGTLDQAFGRTGVATFGSGLTDTGGQLAVAPDNSFYFVGTSAGSTSLGGPTTSQADLFRVSTTGTQLGNYGAPTSLPNTIQAENYDLGGEGLAYHDTEPQNLGGAYRKDGVDIEATNVGGEKGYAVDYTHTGEYLQYTVNNTTPGTFNFVAQVSNYGTGGAFHLEVDGHNVTGTLAVPNTGSFTQFTPVGKNGIAIGAGQHTIRIVFDGQSQYGFSGNLDSIQFIQATTGGAEQPYGGTPFQAGSLVEAENFDFGGEGIAYHDTEPQNLGGQYRPTEGVDIEPTNDLPTTQGNGTEYDVGYTHSGEYLNYTGTFGQAGAYTFNARVANVGAGGSFHVNVDGQNVTGSIAIPTTGGFQSYVNVTASTAPITAGQHVVSIVFDGQSQYGYSGNLNYFRFIPASTSAEQPFNGTPAPISGTIQAENYDLGGEGVAYHDTDAANLGGAYRPNEGVDLESLGNGNYAVDYTHAGEWLKYTVTTNGPRVYTMDAKVANYGSGGAFHLEVDGVNATGTIAVPDTGSFTNYTDVRTQVALPAGQHVLTVVWDANSKYGFAGNLDSITF